MERKQFIRTLSFLAFASPIALSACGDDESLSLEDDEVGGNVDVSTDCAVTPSETEGPYPTKSPTSYIRSDIRKGDDVGIDMKAVFTILNVNASCAVLEGTLVDIWHCDVDGDYSQYNQDSSANWLRGRQVTDTDGNATFQTIFPGWYRGRATHIHVHIYSATGKSLLITQIAFQDSLVQEVNTQGASYGYTKGVSGITYNQQDDIFRDSLSQEMSTVTGSMSAGFEMNVTIRVKG